MELRHLRYFVAVAEELHFGHAAERLNMTQPPLSQQIHQLEEELGAALFRRHARGVALTDAGKVFLGRARTILEDAARAAEDARRADRGEFGELRLALTFNAAWKVLPAIVRRYREQYPAVRLHLDELATGEQIDAFRAGQIDAGFLNLPIPDQEFQWRAVGRDRLVAAVPAGHDLATRGRVPLTDLAQLDWLTAPRRASPKVHDRIAAAFEAGGRMPRIAQEARYSWTLLSFVAAGMGFALVSSNLASVRREGVAFVELDAQIELDLELALAWRSDAASGVLGAFVAVAEAWAAENYTGLLGLKARV
jgi:DNA-binding transcriptional LysR family regulator